MTREPVSESIQPRPNECSMARFRLQPDGGAELAGMLGAGLCW